MLVTVTRWWNITTPSRPDLAQTGNWLIITRQRMRYLKTWPPRGSFSFKCFICQKFAKSWKWMLYIIRIWCIRQEAVSACWFYFYRLHVAVVLAADVVWYLKLNVMDLDNGRLWLSVSVSHENTLICLGWNPIKRFLIEILANVKNKDR